MDYKKINGLLVKDYFSKNKSTKLGTAGDNYIIIPEPSFLWWFPQIRWFVTLISFWGISLRLV